MENIILCIHGLANTIHVHRTIDKRPATPSNHLTAAVLPHAKISRQRGSGLFQVAGVGRLDLVTVAGDVVQLWRCIAEECRKTALVI